MLKILLITFLGFLQISSDLSAYQKKTPLNRDSVQSFFQTL
jgi:hypothetical protein